MGRQERQGVGTSEAKQVVGAEHVDHVGNPATVVVVGKRYWQSAETFARCGVGIGQDRARVGRGSCRWKSV